jgi:hypothetical protein
MGCLFVAGADFGGASDSVDELTSLTTSGTMKLVERPDERWRAALMREGSILNSKSN